MKHIIIRILAGVAVTGGLVSCSVRHADQIINQNPNDPKSPIVESDAPTASQQRLAAFGLREAPEVSANSMTASELLTSSILPLKNLLFDEAIFLDKKENRRNKFRLALAQFNSDIVRLGAIDEKALSASGILAEYEALLFADCDDSATTTCKNLIVFQGDRNLASVFKLMAKPQGAAADQHYKLWQAALEKKNDERAKAEYEKFSLAIDHYYKLLRVALEQPTPFYDHDLFAMYLLKADQLNDLLSKRDPETDMLLPGNAAALDAHRQMLANIWNQFDPKAVDPKLVDDVMSRFRWNISRKIDSMTAGMDKVLNLAASKTLYTDTTKENLDPQFVSQVDEILDAKSEVFGDGIRYIYKQILGGFSKDIFKNLGLVMDIKADEYTYLLDRIYYGHFNSEDALAFWQHTGRDKQRLIDATSKFAKIMIVNRIVWTNQQMNTFFEKEAPKYTSVIPLLMAAIANGVKMYAVWDDTRDSIEKLDLFVADRFGKIDAKALPENDPYRVFNESVTGLTNNIKMLSVYPNMMMLVYMMAKNDFNAKVKTWWGGEVTITASAIVKMFFIDTMAPWFNFGTDKESLTQIELLYAVHFAMQTETFKAYTGNKQLPVDNIGFLKEVVEKMTTDIRIRLEDQTRLIRGHFEANSGLLRDAMEACSVEKVLKPEEDRILAETGQAVWLDRKYVRTISYDNMNAMLANGYSNTGYTAASGTPVGSMTYLYTGLRVPAFLNSLLREINERLLYVENLYGVLDDYVAANNPEERDAFKKAYQDALVPTLKYRNELIKTIYDGLKRFDGCDYVLFKHEVDIRAKTMQMEEEYLGWVYDQFEQMNKLETSGQTAEAEALLASVNTQIAPTNLGLPPGYKGFDAVEKAGSSYIYDYHALDAKLRLGRNLMKLSTGTKVSLPNFERLEEYRTKNTRQVVALMVPTSTPESDVEAARKILRQQFIDDAMKVYISAINPGEYETPSFALNKLDILAKLYRLGPVNEDGSPGCKGEKCLQITPEQIMQETVKILKLADLSPYDMRVLSLRGMEQKHKDEFWNKLSLDESGRRQIGILDLTFQRVATDDADVKDAAPVVNGRFTSYFEDLAKTYYLKEISVGNFLFPPRESVKKLIKANYANYVDDYEQKVDDFIAAYRKLQKDPNFGATGIHRTRNELLEIPMESVKQADGSVLELPAWLWKERIGKYTGLVTDFHKATRQAFKKVGSN